MLKEKYTPQEILNRTIDNVDEKTMQILSKTLSKLPKSVADWAIEKILFVTSSEEFYSFYLHVKGWKNKEGLIFLPEVFGMLPEEKQTFVIARELAHITLGHQGQIIKNLSIEEVKIQRKMASDIAEDWLS